MKQYYYPFLLLASFVLASCGYYEPIDDIEEDNNSILKNESDYFDFSTKSKTNVTIDYGPLGANALIEFFDEFPEQLDADSVPVITGEPFFAGFADADGVLSASITLPSHVSDLWIHTSQYGLPSYVEAKVEDNRISFTNQETKATTRSAATRTVKNPQVWLKDSEYNVYTINPWNDRYGTPIDDNGIISEGTVTSQTIHAIQKALWGGQNQKPQKVFNDKFLSPVLGVINTEIKSEGINNQGQTVRYESAEVWMTFLSEGAWNQNTLGYYIYNTDNPPKSRYEAAKLKKFIIFPNTSVAGHVPFEQTNPSANNVIKRFPKALAPCKPNTRVQLLYVDDEGNVSTQFPAGCSIGYFLVSRPEKTGLPLNSIYSIDFKNIVYSDGALNSNKKTLTVSFMTPDGLAIYGFEDDPGVDTSYEDVLFTIEATPKESIYNPERKILDYTTTGIYGQSVEYSTYMFEDLWPNQGDYDMNDVIVAFNRHILFDSKNNATKITDSFTPTQPQGSAGHTNAFAFVNSTIMACNPSVECSEGIMQDQSGAFVIFTNTNVQRGQTATITYTFETGKGPSKLNLSQYDDAFIIANTKDPMKGNRTEVHSPGFKPTSLADKSLNGTNEDAYYRTKDGNYPFSMQIADRNITPVSEGISIELEYTLFADWVRSKGATNGNWYKWHNRFQQ